MVLTDERSMVHTLRRKQQWTEFNTAYKVHQHIQEVWDRRESSANNFQLPVFK